ncbi:MAG: hypothetical protein GX097_05340 [Methanomicrobiales archaeon]|nr:hypothetical protein [Methanomicrobiales archaeon]
MDLFLWPPHITFCEHWLSSVRHPHVMGGEQIMNEGQYRRHEDGAFLNPYT